MNIEKYIQRSYMELSRTVGNPKIRCEIENLKTEAEKELTFLENKAQELEASQQEKFDGYIRGYYD